MIDLFAGAGGFSVAAHRHTNDVIGFELDDDACETQRAAGMNVVQVDLSKAGTGAFYDDGTVHLHLHASPPCTTFSAAGRGHGRKFIDDLCVAVRDIMAGDDFDEVLAGLPDDIDDTSKLVLVPARWIVALEPDTVSMEQVRAVLPIWEAYAEAMELILGYESTWTELLHGEQYGLPQTRTRAWLGASKTKQAGPPKPTHSRYHARDPKRLDDGVLPWVSMAEALGWEPAARAGFPRRADTDDAVEIDGVKYRARDLIDADGRPSLAVTEKMRSWMATRPATTVMGDPRIWPPGHKVNQADRDRHPDADERYGDRAGKRARKITIAEAARLQGFPDGFPFQGTKTSQFRQVGNAVPPPVAEAVLRSLLEVE